MGEKAPSCDPLRQDSTSTAVLAQTKHRTQQFTVTAKASNQSFKPEEVVILEMEDIGGLREASGKPSGNELNRQP